MKKTVFIITISVAAMISLAALSMQTQKCTVVDSQIGSNITEKEVDGLGYPSTYTSMKPNVGEYINLGLPSGTLWKIKNEEGLYTYDQAVCKFGSKLPTKEQLEELKTSCQWTWIGNGYKVVGPNEESIILPAAGHRGCHTQVSRVGLDGSNWSSTPEGYAGAWCLDFNSCEVKMYSLPRCSGQSVRLVQD